MKCRLRNRRKRLGCSPNIRSFFGETQKAGKAILKQLAA